MSERFSREYYRRFYQDPATRVLPEEGYSQLSHFVAAYLAYLEVPVGQILDLGCGLGHWRPLAESAFPEARYKGVEISAALCEDLGWEKGSVDTYRGGPADLVICQGVLQYLKARDAERAIRNLARLTRGALYLEVLTREDWEHAVDQSRTDGDVNLRSADWYRSRLRTHFRSLGGGLFLPKNTDVVLYELEAL